MLRDSEVSSIYTYEYLYTNHTNDPHTYIYVCIESCHERGKTSCESFVWFLYIYTYVCIHIHRVYIYIRMYRVMSREREVSSSTLRKSCELFIWLLIMYVYRERERERRSCHETAKFPLYIRMYIYIEALQI